MRSDNNHKKSLRAERHVLILELCGAAGSRRAAHRLSARRRRSPRSAEWRPGDSDGGGIHVSYLSDVRGGHACISGGGYKEVPAPRPPGGPLRGLVLRPAGVPGTAQAMLDLGIAPLAMAKRVGLVEIPRVFRVAVEPDIYRTAPAQCPRRTTEPRPAPIPAWPGGGRVR